MVQAAASDKRRQPRVRVILPTYNRAFVVAEAVQSVVDQTFTDWELLIIDDGSTDETRNVLKQIRERDDRIHVLHQNNGGAAKARNQGITYPGDHELIAFIDSDDLWESYHLSEAVQVIEQYPSVGLVFARTESIDHAGKLSEQGAQARMRAMNMPRKLQKQSDSSMDSSTILLDESRLLTALLNEEICPHTPTVVLRRESIGQHRFPSHLIVLEDLYFWAQLASSGLGFAFIDRPHAKIRYFGDNLTMARPLGDPETVRRQESALQFSIEKIQLCHSPVQRKSVRQFVAWRSYLLGQCYLSSNRRWRAASVYLRGFWISGSIQNLRGLTGLLIPEIWKTRIKSVFSRIFNQFVSQITEKEGGT
jgi:glycosyltransferase involved in cell wall biosynthesis